MVAKSLCYPRARRSPTMPGVGIFCGALGLVATLVARADVAEPAGPPAGTRYYSTAAPPRDYPGPRPTTLAPADPEPPRPAVPDLVPVEPPRTEPESPPASASPAA